MFIAPFSTEQVKDYIEAYIDTCPPEDHKWDLVYLQQRDGKSPRTTPDLTSLVAFSLHSASPSEGRAPSEYPAD